MQPRPSCCSDCITGLACCEATLPSKQATILCMPSLPLSLSLVKRILGCACAAFPLSFGASQTGVGLPFPQALHYCVMECIWTGQHITSLFHFSYRQLLSNSDVLAIQTMEHYTGHTYQTFFYSATWGCCPSVFHFKLSQANKR